MKKFFYLLVGLLLGWTIHALISTNQVNNQITLPLPQLQFSASQHDENNDNSTSLKNSSTQKHKTTSSANYFKQLNLSLQKRDQEKIISSYKKCLESLQATNCRNLLADNMPELLQSTPITAENLIQIWLEYQANDPVALFYQAFIYESKEQYKKAISQILELRFQPQPEIPDQILTDSLRGIISRTLQKMRKNNKKNEIYDFLTFLTEEDNGNPYYHYLLGLEQQKHGKLTEAMETLTRIIYDAQWGEKAREKMDEIKSSFVSSAEPETSVDKNKKQLIRIALKRSGRHFIVNSLVNNYHTLSLLIDTGASLTSIKRESLKRIGIADKSSREVQLITAGGPIQTSLIRLRELSISNFKIRDIDIAVLKGNDLSNVDGLLGMNFLGLFDFYIDQEESVLYLSSND